MAVPFTMPEDQNEVDVLLVQIKTLLNRVHAIVQQKQQATSSSSSSSSTSSTSSSSRVRHRVRNREVSQELSESVVSVPQGVTIPDLLASVSWLAANANETVNSTSPLTAISIRSPQRRTNSQSSNTDETMISITAITVKHDYCAQDWNKIDCVETEEPKELPKTNSLFSKITPASISSCSLMTAMICFVGWHIFRAR